MIKIQRYFIYQGALLFCVLCCISILSNRQVYAAETGVSIECSINSPRITMNGSVSYTVRVKWNGAGEDYSFTWPDPPRSSLLEITGNAASSGRTIENGTTVAVRTFSYTLNPLKTGTAVIEPVFVTYRTSDGTGATLQTRTVQVEILPAPGEFPVKVVLLTALLLLLAGSGVVGLILYRKRSNTAATTLSGGDGADISPELTPVEQARHSSEGLEHLIMEGEFKEYCTGIGRVARVYVEKRYLLAFGNRLTAEVLDIAAHEKVPQEGIDCLKLILETGDTLKYSTGDPTKEQSARLKGYLLDLLKTD